MSRIERTNEKFKRAGTKANLHEARAEARETRMWVCGSCDRMIEDFHDDAPYCRYCGEYWRDVDSGLFADDRC